jgi:DNA-binding CsgD family transcriptional regulator
MRGWAETEWLELLADLMACPLRELPVEPLAWQLNRTFDGVACAFSTPREGGSLDPPAVEVVEWIAPGPGAVPIKRLHPLVRSHPTLRFHLESAEVTGPVGVVAAWSCRYQLGVPLSGHGHRAFVVGRDVEFADREIDLAKRIRRLIVGLDQQVRTFAADRATATANARMTPREQAVLGELARGVTAAVISRRLGISERTVHKHLEHIYGKLEVTDRLSAVLRARDAGLIAG